MEGLGSHLCEWGTLNHFSVLPPLGALMRSWSLSFARSFYLYGDPCHCHFHRMEMGTEHCHLQGILKGEATADSENEARRQKGGDTWGLPSHCALDQEPKGSPASTCASDFVLKEPSFCCHSFSLPYLMARWMLTRSKSFQVFGWNTFDVLHDIFVVPKIPNHFLNGVLVPHGNFSLTNMCPETRRIT